MKKIILLVFTALISISCGGEKKHRIARIPEASGICYCADSDTLVVANDEGKYYEISRDGEILSKQKAGKYDLEGVACADKDFIFVIEDEGLLFVDRENGKKKKVTFDTTYHNKELPLFEKKNGAEGIAKSGKYLYIAKQAKKKHDSFIAIVRTDRYHTKIVDIIKAKIPDIAGLTIYNGSLYFVSDKKDLLLRYDIQKKKIIHKVKLPKSAQEGIAFDGKGFVYIADDNGYVLKYSEKELGL